jgi:TPR repeat protein
MELNGLQLIGVFIALIFIMKAIAQANHILCSIKDQIERVSVYVERIWEESDLIERHTSGRDEEGPKEIVQSNLGLIFDNGQGVTLCNKEAANLFKMSAEQGQANAQSNLGQMYYNGQGVAKDYKEAVKWYRMSAEQGHANAQNKLGKMYAKGKGVTQDYVQALMWFYLATVKGNKDATRNKALTEKHMTSKDISTAQKLAKEWVGKKPKAVKEI